MLNVHRLTNDTLTGLEIFAAITGTFVYEPHCRGPRHFTHPERSYLPALLYSHVPSVRLPLSLYAASLAGPVRQDFPILQTRRLKVCPSCSCPSGFASVFVGYEPSVHGRLSIMHQWKG